MEKLKNNFLFKAFSLVFKDILFVFLALSLALNLLAIYYFIFSQTTTFAVFFESNSALYNWLSIGSAALLAVFLGIAVALFAWQWKNQNQAQPAHLGNSFIASFLGGVATGCPTCGAFLASVLGIGGGLVAFPFQGLEVKAIALFLSGFAIFSSAKAISKKTCQPGESSKNGEILKIEKGKLIFNISKETLKPLAPAFLGFVLLFLVAYLPALANKFNFRISFQPNSQANISGAIPLAGASKADFSDTLQKINPSAGFEINAVYGDIGPKLLQSGAIDFEKMKLLYERAGQPLTQEQIKILTLGSNEKIRISPENSYFLLNFLWAVGLANKNKILDEGPIAKYGKDQIGNFASTGGWTLGKKPATELFSRFEIIRLNSDQQKILEDFAFNSYRPCCSNPTGFPDCNHGIAALALGEIMAGQGRSAQEIFEAFKYVNAFWFPQTYLDVANYFLAKEGKDWSQVDPRVIAGKDYSTPQGWQKIHNWLKTNGLLEEAPESGGGCGV